MKSEIPKEISSDCSKKCILIVLSSLNFYKNEKISRLIEKLLCDFKGTSLHFNDKGLLYNAVLKYSKQEGYLMCHKGTLYLEKYLLTDFYSEFILESSYFDENQFINNKIEIYHWLKPENFGIEVSMQYIREVSPFCTLINKFVTPTEKLYCIIEISKKIYKFGNQKMGQDEFFPVFIFTFIHLKVKDLLYNLVYIKKYKSIQAKLCTNICTHVFLDNYKIIENDCECVTRISNATEKEMCFYLVNFEAMVNFIKRFEYKDLDIKKDVYDDNISNNLKNIDLSEYSSSKIKFKKDLIKGFKESFSKFIDYISKID